MGHLTVTERRRESHLTVTERGEIATFILKESEEPTFSQ